MMTHPEAGLNIPGGRECCGAKRPADCVHTLHFILQATSLPQVRCHNLQQTEAWMILLARCPVTMALAMQQYVSPLGNEADFDGASSKCSSELPAGVHLQVGLLPEQLRCLLRAPGERPDLVPPLRMHDMPCLRPVPCHAR